MNTLFCKSGIKENGKKAKDGKKIIIEKAKRVRPWPDLPVEKKSIPENDKKR